jgi:hypothetical protein
MLLVEHTAYQAPGREFNHLQSIPERAAVRLCDAGAPSEEEAHISAGAVSISRRSAPICPVSISPDPHPSRGTVDLDTTSGELGGESGRIVRRS